MRSTLQGCRTSTGLLVAIALGLVAGCGSTPPRSGRDRGGVFGGADGPGALPPAGLEQVADAVPRVEPLRVGGPNKRYELMGRTYVPMTEDRAFGERGLASWYGAKFHGLPTASGEPYDMYAMTAAHPTMPIPSYARVRNPANGREIIVRVNDRGPFYPGRIIDLSYTAALKLDLLRGVAPVELERITFDAIRAGTWQRGTPEAAAVQLASFEDPKARDTGAISASPPADLPLAPPPTAAPPDPPAALALPSNHGERGLAQATTAAGFWVQLGAFRQREGATDFRRRVVSELDWLAPLLAVFDDSAWFRLQAGPYASRQQASEAAQSIRAALQLVPLIVERR